MKEIIWKPYHLLQLPPSADLSRWLLHTGSFIQRLQQFGIAGLVHVLNERWQLPLPTERQLLNLPYRTYARVREVLIDSAEGKWMFARTVIPAITLTGKEQQLANLKNRSLGSILFNHAAMTRSEFEFTCLHPEMGWHEKICQHIPAFNQKLWARRSVFHLDNKPLLLSEIFSPEIKALKNAAY